MPDSKSPGPLWVIVFQNDALLLLPITKAILPQTQPHHSIIPCMDCCSPPYYLVSKPQEEVQKALHTPALLHPDLSPLVVGLVPISIAKDRLSSHQLEENMLVASAN